MENTEGNNDHKSNRAHWTEVLDRVLIELAYEQTLKGNRPGTSFNKLGWNFIRDEFFKRTENNYTHKQLKNHLSILKAKWRAWNKLIQNTGFAWDPIKKVVTATDECWANYIKVKPNAEIYKTSTCPLYEEMETIFGDTYATNWEAFAPIQDVELTEGENDLSQEDSDVSGYSSMFEGLTSGFGTSDDVSGTSEEEVCSNRRKRQCHTPSSPRQGKRKSRISLVTKLVEALINVTRAWLADTDVAVTAPLVSAPTSDAYSITSCVKVLQQMESIDQKSNAFYKAIEMFVNPTWREAFMCMMPSQRLGWLKTLES